MDRMTEQEKTYTIYSIKATEIMTTTLDVAISRAKEMLEVHQPAYGVQIFCGDDVVWDSEEI
jgi:CYTH domain-containing protein